MNPNALVLTATALPSLLLVCSHPHAAVADSLLQCLELQGLTSFLGAVNMSQFFELLNGTDMKVTLFVPTNAAFEEAGMLLDAPDMLVGNHLVLGTVQEDDLVSTMRFLTLAGTHLHSTTVIYYDYGSSYGGYTYTQSRVVSIYGYGLYAEELYMIKRYRFSSVHIGYSMHCLQECNIDNYGTL